MRQITQAEIAFKVGLNELNASTQDGGGHSSGRVVMRWKSSGVVTQEIAGQSGGYAIQEQQSAVEAGAFFMKENFHQTAQSQVLKYVVGSQLGLQVTSSLSDLLQDFIRQQNDSEFRGVSHLEPLRMIELADRHRACTDVF